MEKRIQQLLQIGNRSNKWNPKLNLVNRQGLFPINCIYKRWRNENNNRIQR